MPIAIRCSFRSFFTVFSHLPIWVVRFFETIFQLRTKNNLESRLFFILFTSSVQVSLNEDVIHVKHNRLSQHSTIIYWEFSKIISSRTSSVCGQPPYRQSKLPHRRRRMRVLWLYRQQIEISVVRYLVLQSPSEFDALPIFLWSSVANFFVLVAHKYVKSLTCTKLSLSILERSPDSVDPGLAWYATSDLLLIVNRLCWIGKSCNYLVWMNLTVCVVCIFEFSN